jgi:energy-coupling factor transport system permease protein
MRLSVYLDHDTALHRLHPQVKLGILGATFASVYGVDQPMMVLPVTATLALLLVAGGAVANVRRFAPMFIGVPIATFVVWSLFYGRAPGAAGVLPRPRAEAMEFAAGMALKLESFLGASVLFLSITRVEEFTDALRGLGLPYRMSFAIALAFRLVPLFLTSALSVVAAQRARGLDFSRGGLLARLGRYMPVVVPVFMGALRRAEAMAMALESRGFGRQTPRSTFARSRFGVRDLCAATTLAVVVAVYLWAWAHGWGKVGPR